MGESEGRFLNYRYEYYSLIIFIVGYAISSVIISLIVGTLVGHVLFFTLFGLPSWLFWRWLARKVERKYNGTVTEG